MPVRPAYLTQNRHGTFYFRIMVPSPLRSALGLQREIRRSLKTDSQRLALRRARQYAARHEAAFDKALSMITQDGTPITDEDLEHSLAEIERAGKPEQWGAWGGPPVAPSQRSESPLTDDDRREMDHQQRWALISEILTGTAGRSIPADQQPLAQQLFDLGRRIPYRLFARTLPARLESLALAKPDHNSPSPSAVVTAAPTEPDGPSLFELWEQKWANEKGRGGKKVEATKIDESAHARKLHILSGGKPINRMTVTDFEDIYCKVPQIRLRRGRALPPLESAPESLLSDGKQIHPKTAKKTVQHLAALHAFAFRKGLTTVGPDAPDRPLFDLAPAGVEEKQRAFTRSDLEAIFSGYLYTKDAIENSRSLFPYQFWLPLLGLYTGGRLNELCQLYTEDVSLRDADGAPEGIWTLDIADDPQDKPLPRSLKNNSSRRILPIHSDLIRMGFLDFVEQARAEGREKLFSDGLTYKVKSGWGAMASTFFCRMPAPSTPARGYLAFVGVRKRDASGETDGKNFHSFRHTFVDMTRNAGAETYLVAPDLTGHSRKRDEGSLTSYGNGFALAKKVAALESLPIAVDLSAISYADFLQRLGGKLSQDVANHRVKYGLNPREAEPAS